MAISDLFGINSTAGTDQLKQALAALQGVQAPTAAQLTLPQLQKYVAAGVLTPEQYQAISANPQAFQDIANSADQTGNTAQKSALQQLGGIVQAGGSTPINQATLLNNIQQTNQAMQAARKGITSEAQQRGVAGGGLEFINQLMNEQSNAQNANTGAVNAASNNAQLALSALASQGTLGGQVQGQENQQAQAKAQAAQQVAEYNSQLQSAANQYNVQNANQAQQMNLSNAQDISNKNTGNANAVTQYNAQVPQTVFDNSMRKAGAVAGNYGQQADLAQKQAQQQNAFTGNLIGAGATLGGSYIAGQALAGGVNGNQGQGFQYGPPKSANTNQYSPSGYAHGGEVSGRCYAQGGEVHDHQLCMKVGGDVPGEAEVPGDSSQNDTVDAKLSPHEIVLPRSVAQAPDAPQKAASFVQGVKGDQQMPGLNPTIGSFADALKILEENGLELRLAQKGV